MLIDQYLENATEVDVDALCDATGRVVIGGLMEHIEPAGVHSGDSACALPAVSLEPQALATIRQWSEALALALQVNGLINLQFAIKDGDVYIIEANPRASRTVPFVAKATGVPLADVEVARLVVALSDVTVRDACLGWALDDDPADVAQLWTALVRAAPTREVADAAVLLALTLLVRGGGGLVGAALERARTADPAHRLTFLVESMLAHGLGREDIRTVVVESGREATAALAA